MRWGVRLRLAYVIGLAIIGALVAPSAASAISTHFTVINATSYALKLNDIATPTAQDTPARIDRTDVPGRPPDGAVIPSGTTAGFEVTYFFLSTNGGRADFSLLNGDQAVGAAHVTMVQYGLGGVRTDCRIDNSSTLCAGAGQDSSSVTVIDPPGTVHDVPASLKQQQADALKTLCANGNAASCHFTANKQAHLESEPHQVGGHVDNPHDYDEKTTIHLKDTVGTSDSVDVGITAGTELFEVVKVEVEAKYSHEWTAEHTFEQDVELTIPSKKRCWFVATAPIIRYTGDFKVTLGNTTWNLTDVYFDGPDTDQSPPAANWGYSPTCVDLPSSSRESAPAPGSRIVLQGRYRTSSAAVKKPRLKVRIVGPSRLHPAVPTAYRIVVSRRPPGRHMSYPASNVSVRVRSGHRQLRRWVVKTLSLGQDRALSVAVPPSTGGDRRVCLTATARARNAIGARATRCLSVSSAPIDVTG
jgi:hypothetical protein